MNSSVDTSTAKSYLDFSGLGELRAKASQDQNKAIKETAQQFEGMFIQMMMKSMRAASEPMQDEENASSARQTFEEMFDREVSVQMAKRSALGVGDFIERAVKQRIPAAADVLKARDSHGLPLHTPAAPMSLQTPTQQGLSLQQKPLIKSLKEVHMQRRPDGGAE